MKEDTNSIRLLKASEHILWCAPGRVSFSHHFKNSCTPGIPTDDRSDDRDQNEYDLECLADRTSD